MNNHKDAACEWAVIPFITTLKDLQTAHHLKHALHMTKQALEGKIEIIDYHEFN